MNVVNSEKNDANCGTGFCCYASYQPKRQECTRLNRCLVMQEFRMSNEDHRRKYDAECRARAEQLDQQAKPSDVMHHLQRAVVPQKNLDPLLGTPRQTSSMVGAKSWWSKVEIGGSRTLLLAGPSGIGKSTAAAWVAMQWALVYPWNNRPSGNEHKVPIVWLEGGHIAQLAEWSTRGAEELQRARQSQLLVINDGGLEATKPSMIALANLCILRSDANKLLVFTTNLTAKNFATRYGEALADRFAMQAFAPPLEREKSQR